MKLRDLFITYIGVSRKKSSNGNVKYLQFKDFVNGKFEKSSTTQFTTDFDEKHLLINNDLLFVAKGDKNPCFVYNEEIGKAVASSSFIIIRCDANERINPKYLAFYINLPKINQRLKLEAKGSSILSISKSSIENLDIEVPPMELQKKIVRLDKLQKDEFRMLQEIANTKQELMNETLYNLIKNEV